MLLLDASGPMERVMGLCAMSSDFLEMAEYNLEKTDLWMLETADTGSMDKEEPLCSR